MTIRTPRLPRRGCTSHLKVGDKVGILHASPSTMAFGTIIHIDTENGAATVEDDTRWGHGGTKFQHHTNLTHLWHLGASGA